MKFEKRNFMGIELDVLVGHPEYDLLFVATQVARAAGLKDPHSASHAVATLGLGIRVESIGNIPRDGHRVKSNSWLFTEGAVYRMLMRGSTDKAKEFQDWIADEVAPSIRKTGSYNAADSQNPIALAIMDELKSLRGEIVSLRQELQAKTFSLEAPKAVEVSPYEGQPGVG